MEVLKMEEETLVEICEEIIDKIGNGELEVEREAKEIQVLTELIKMRVSDSEKRRKLDLDKLGEMRWEVERVTEMMDIVKNKIKNIRGSLEEILKL